MSHHWSRFSQGQNWHLCIERTIKGLGREQVIWNSDVVHTVPIISKIVTSMHRERCMFFPNKSGLWIFPMNQSHVPLEWEQNQIMLEKTWFLCRISQTFHRVSTWHRATQGWDQEILSRLQAYLTRILTYHTLLSWL